MGAIVKQFGTWVKRPKGRRRSQRGQEHFGGEAEKDVKKERSEDVA